jgi:hypothetical protein
MQCRRLSVLSLGGLHQLTLDFFEQLLEALTLLKVPLPRGYLMN